MDPSRLRVFLESRLISRGSQETKLDEPPWKGPGDTENSGSHFKVLGFINKRTYKWILVEAQELNYD